MASKNGVRTFQSPDGITWTVDVRVPSHSSAMIFFRHPSGESARRDRYAWYNAELPEASDPRSRLTPARVLEQLTDRDIARLYRRSMPVHTSWPSYVGP
ncbi:MAG TPA: hypothetical protein VF178_01510 [Gemmatimonadaceae bacterium]